MVRRQCVADVAQRAEEQREVDLGFEQQREAFAYQQLLGLTTRHKAELGRVHRFVLGHIHVAESLESALHSVARLKKWRDGFGEAHEVPLRDGRLLAKAIPARAGIGGIGRPGGIEVVEPAVGTVIDRETKNRHIVGVHHAVHEAHAHPVHDHVGGALAHFGKPRDTAFGGLSDAGQRGKVARDGEVNELGEQREVIARGENLEVAEADERRRDAAHNGTRFRRGVAVVEHVTHHAIASGHERQGAGGRHPQMMHRFAAQKLANRRTQHRAAVGGARVRRGTGPLELQLPALAGGVHHFAQRHGPSVAQLTGPVPELMPAVAGGVRIHAWE